MCVGGGFGASKATTKEKPKWMLNTVWAQGTETEAESFLWYRVNARLQVGVAYLWRQQAFRGLATYVLSPETSKAPMLSAGFGLQGIGTGNPGYFLTAEKTLDTKIGTFNGFLGAGYRSNEDHSHALGGLKFTPTASPYTFGVQLDGHQGHLFVTRDFGAWSLGAYLIDMKAPGAMLSVRF
jgi:hypothetical protein